MTAVIDAVAIVLAILGGVFAVSAAVGLFRLGDVRSRMHAATKPATLGVLAFGIAAMIRADSPDAIARIAIIVVLQLVTAPVGAHMLSRAISKSDRDR
jgi:multicomponent Na+:H+ antiporter subunit G